MTNHHSDDVWPEWVCDYQFDGEKYGLNIIARDAAEASRRLRAIGMTAQVKGELMGIVPAYPGAGLYVRLKVFWKNLLRPA